MLRSRERVARILARQGDGCVAYDALGSQPVFDAIEGLGLPEEWREYLRRGEFRYLALDPGPGDRERFAAYLPGLPREAEVSSWGIGRVALKSVEGWHAGHRYWHPLAGVESVRDLESYPFPDPTGARDPEELRREVASLKAEGFTVIGQMSQTILETAYLMRGIDRLFMDLVERPEYVDALFAKLAERRIAQARVFAQAGADLLRIGDDIATQEGLMLSPRLYRERIKPHHAAVVAEARRWAPGIPVLYHSDGRLTDLLPDLIEIGVTAINPVQPECMDLLETKREFGRHLALWGCTPVQSLFAHGAEEEVRRHTRFLLEKGAAGHGLILQFINIILTPAVLRNLGAFFDEFARGRR